MTARARSRLRSRKPKCFSLGQLTSQLYHCSLFMARSTSSHSSPLMIPHSAEPEFFEGDVFKIIIPLSVGSMTKVGPGTSPVASGEVGGEVSGEVAADAVTIKLDVQKITDRKRAALNESSPCLKSIKSMLFQKPRSVPSAISFPP